LGLGGKEGISLEDTFGTVGQKREKERKKV